LLTGDAREIHDSVVANLPQALSSENPARVDVIKRDVDFLYSAALGRPRPYNNAEECLRTVDRVIPSGTPTIEQLQQI
jgi:hypothetical protein